MGSKCITIHYLESEKIQFMTNVFAKVEEAKLNIFHASRNNNIDNDFKICLDCLCGYWALGRTKKYSQVFLNANSYDLSDAYHYITTGFHFDGTKGTVPDDIRELSAFVLEYGDYFDLILEKIKKDNKDFYNKIISESEVFHSHQ